jgi:rhodanese-related sulfurtransferase
MIKKLLQLSGLMSSSQTGSVVTHINAAEAAAKLKDPKVFLLDVRSNDEYRSGYIEGAKLIPLGELQSRLGELESAKDKVILVYCHSGMRSRSAASLLAGQGFNAMNLKGGISSWISGGNPVKRGKK